MDPVEKDFIKTCLTKTADTNTPVANRWYQDRENMTSIARILDGEFVFNKTSDVVYFMEKPWKWESDMQELLEDES